MNPIMMSNAQFYFALSVPLVGILVNVVLITTLCHRLNRLGSRLDRLGDRVQAGCELLMARLARLEERLSH
jgi:hypothetical protein